MCIEFEATVVAFLFRDFRSEITSNAICRTEERSPASFVVVNDAATVQLRMCRRTSYTDG